MTDWIPGRYRTVERLEEYSAARSRAVGLFVQTAALCTGIHLNPIVTRYVWPAELDLMARIARLRLKERWAGWSRELFTSTSSNCVSVYGR